MPEDTEPMKYVCGLPIPGTIGAESHCECWFDSEGDVITACCWCGYDGDDSTSCPASNEGEER